LGRPPSSAGKALSSEAARRAPAGDAFDEDEQFEAMATELVLKQDPEMLAFHQAKKTVQRRQGKPA